VLLPRSTKRHINLSAMPILRALIILGLVNQLHCVLRFSANVPRVHETQNPIEDDKDLKAIGKEFDAAGKAAEKDAKKAADAVQKGPGEESSKRKPMDAIESMRAMMCWGRKNLLEHEKCMEWMTVNCKKETTGEGYCKKLRRYLKSKCKKGQQLACDYAKKLGIDMATDTEKTDPDDMDGDGVKDKDDAFPDNPLESKDSDGDGVGDNHDKWPNDPTCSDEGDVCGGPAPAPGLSPAPGPAPAPSGGLTMDENVPLPSQGYNEFSRKYVAHDDGKTMTSDWRGEWPMSNGDEDDSVKSICAKNPEHVWCKLKQSKAARKVYVVSHP